MLILSVGMQKSGSGLLFNLTNDLLIRAGHCDVREVREKYGLEDILKFHNCNVGELSDEKLNRLLEVALIEKPFVIKTHAGIRPYVLRLLQQDRIKATVIYRDPRDVVISAMDHGKKIREQNGTHSFANCTSLEITVDIVRAWLDKSILPWLEYPSSNLLVMRYEQLISKPLEQLLRLAEFLDLHVALPELADIYRKYDTSNMDDFMKDYLHFNIGRTERFREVLTSSEIDYCNHAFHQHLLKLEYIL